MKFSKKVKLLIAVLFSVLIMSSCTMTRPINATGNPIGPKVGYSQASVIFGIYFDADASIKEAAKQGGITKISTVEFKTSNILYLFMVYTCIVTGE